ncbi:MAG: ribokinase [Chloroflexi bacterium]|nr:ribokinase [Chloroflexota bacterium]
MNPDGPVVVIGATGIDIKGRAVEPLQLGTSVTGIVRSSRGGVARNVAENLARLEVPTVLLSAVGQDHDGEYLLDHTTAAGVDTSRVLRLPAAHTGSYVSLLDQDGHRVYAIAEYDIISAISPSYLQSHRRVLADASMLVIDANLSPRALATVFRLARRYAVPVCADPTSNVLATKLIPHLAALQMVAPDAQEAAILCGAPDAPATSEEAIDTAQRLVSLGVEVAIVTLGEMGLAYSDGSSAGHIAALNTSVVDRAGVGDALTAAVIFGLLNEMPTDEALRLGIAAAALTLRTRESVHPDLTLDLLYDQLIV